MFCMTHFFLKFRDFVCSNYAFRRFRSISALRVFPAETQVDGLPPASSISGSVSNFHSILTRRAEILLASKSNYGGWALGLGMKWLKFEFSDM